MEWTNATNCRFSSKFGDGWLDSEKFGISLKRRLKVTYRKSSGLASMVSLFVPGFCYLYSHTTPIFVLRRSATVSCEDPGPSAKGDRQYFYYCSKGTKLLCSGAIPVQIRSLQLPKLAPIYFRAESGPPISSGPDDTWNLYCPLCGVKVTGRANIYLQNSPRRSVGARHVLL